MRAIGGISRGGVWSLEIGFNSQTFGVVAGHSACLNLNESPPEYDPLQMARLPALTTLRIWLDSGDQDDCLRGVQDMHAALQAADVPHYYRIYPGVHEDALWAAHLDEYLEFYTATWPRR
jgi:enterochelin esterase-like enzyme